MDQNFSEFSELGESDKSLEFSQFVQLAEMALLASNDLTTSKKKLPPVRLNLMQEIIIGWMGICL